MQATLRRRPCCPAQTGEWKGARNRTFRAGHRPWTGGWPGTPWNSLGQQVTARADGAGAGRIVELLHPDDSQQQNPVPLSLKMTNELFDHHKRKTWQFITFNILGYSYAQSVYCTK